jgi:hypothetical protein
MSYGIGVIEVFDQPKAMGQDFVPIPDKIIANTALFRAKWRECFRPMAGSWRRGHWQKAN